MRNNIFNIALIQQKAVSNDAGENVEKGIDYVRKSKELGADMVLFWECWLHNYDYPQIDFKLSKEELFENKEYCNWADKVLDDHSESIKKFCSAAKELNIGIAVTCFTKGKEYPQNSVFIIGRDGKIIMKYSKVHTCDFCAESLCESGDEFKVCEFDGVKLGAMICYDREFPESARVLMLKGAEIILVPNCCDMNPFRLNQLSTRAAENMVAVAMTNAPGSGMGCSCAYSPIVFDKDGKYVENTIVMAGDTGEGIFMASFDIEQLRDYRNREVWGNTFRKVHAYKEIVSESVNEPFIREHYRK